jgi:hypothetical protein
MLGRLKEMCRTLYDAGKDELLHDLRAGRLTLREVWAIYRTGNWRRLPSAQHALPFARSYEAWRMTKPAAYARFAGWAQNAIVPLPETLAGLRASLLRYRAASEDAKRAAMFNRVLATVRAFLRDTVTTEEYGWQESERVLEDAEVKLRALLAPLSDGGQTGGHST